MFLLSFPLSLPLIEPWDVKYVSAVLFCFCFILDILFMLCVKIKNKNVYNKKKKKGFKRGLSQVVLFSA